MVVNGKTGYRKILIAMTIMALTFTVGLGMVHQDDEGALGATTVGNIKVSGGTQKTYDDVDYILYGDIEVSGTGSKLVFIDSKITISQDVGNDGVLGGGDDHIYNIIVENGGELVLENSHLTSRTDQLHPYFAMEIIVRDSGSKFVLDGSLIEGPGMLTVSNSAEFHMSSSSITAFSDQDNLAYDIDGDGSTDDDRDYNDDSVEISFTTGAKAVITDSQIRDTFSFDVPSRDGRNGGNIVASGSGTNITVINSFLDIDLESRTQTGTHNTLSLSGGAVAHLVGVSINKTATTASSAIDISGATSRAYYYRWIGAAAFDGVNLPISGADFSVYRIEGSQDRLLSSAYLTSEILSYMERTTGTWSRTDNSGMAMIPVVTDVFSADSMPNSEAYPDFRLTMTVDGKTISAKASFDPYPSIAGQNDEYGLIERFTVGETVSTYLVTDLRGSFRFEDHIVNPVLSSTFSGISVYTNVGTTMTLKGTSAAINGTVYPSYYAFGGHLIVGSGGSLTITDTFVSFLNDQGPLYILVQNGGTLVMNNVTLSGTGPHGLYVYVMGTGTPSMKMTSGNFSARFLALRQAGSVDIVADSFSSSLNSVGSSSSVKVRSGGSYFGSIYARDGSMDLGGGNLSLPVTDFGNVQLKIEDALVKNTLDLDRDSEIINSRFNGTLPSGRSHWIKASGSGVVRISNRMNARVVDSVSNPIPGSLLRAYRISPGGATLFSSILTDDKAEGTLVLVQEEIRSTGRTYLGNYMINASYTGYESSPYTANIVGKDIDLIVTIQGSPDLAVEYVNIVGSMIDGNDVKVSASIVNHGRFASKPFVATFYVNGMIAGESNIDALAPGASTIAVYNWTPMAGMADLIIQLDRDGNVREIDRSNNIWNTVNLIGFGPDYSIHIETEDEQWVYGVERTITVILRNVGEEDPEENAFTVDIMWRKGLEFGYIFKDLEFDYIPPGEMVEKTLNWTPSVSGNVILTGEIFAKFDSIPVNSYFSLPLDIKTLPDLVIREGSLGIDKVLPLTINSEAIISFTVDNLGDLPSGPFVITIYDGAEDEGRIIGGNIAVSNIGPRDSKLITTSWRPALPVGIHDLIIVLDRLDQVKEQNEDNNNLTIPVPVDTEPDLYLASAIGFSSSPITDGRNLTIWVHVGNRGNTKAYDADIRFALDSYDTLLDRIEMDLLPGQIVNVSVNWEAEDPGEHTIYVVLDFFNKIFETNENNNLGSKVIYVRTKADLSMRDTDLQVSPAGPLPLGEMAYLNATIWNTGETDAQNVIVTFYDGDPDQGGRIISWRDTQPSVNLEDIRSGTWKKASVSWIPTTGGWHKIYVIMDPLNLIVESDKENNKMSWDVYVKTLPDLSFSSIKLMQGGFVISSSGVGKNIRINATIVNNGDMPAGEFALTMYNGNPLYSEDSFVIGQENRFPQGRLPGKSSINVEISWKVEYPKGIREIFAEVRTIEGAESDRTNNQISTLLEVFDLDDVPELHPVADSIFIGSRYVGIDPLESGIGYVGMNLTVYANISNTGGKAVTNATVMFMSFNGTHEWLSFSKVIDSIESGDNVSIMGWWNLKDSGHNGLRIIVDPDNDIKEFDEGNNVQTIELDVVTAPDLSIQLVRSGDHYDPETGQFNIFRGSEYTVSFDIINNGNFTYNGLEVVFTGKALVGEQRISVNPYSTERVSFTVRSDISYDVPVSWKCQVNPDREHFESDFDNNEAAAIFSISEPVEVSFPWLILIIVVFIIALIVFAIVYFLVIRTQKGQMAKCSNCGGLVEIEATSCKHCGVEFSEEIECECGTIIPQGAKECPNCKKPVITPEPVEDEGGPETPAEEEKAKDEEEETEEEKTQEDEKPEDEEALSDNALVPPPTAESEMAECYECGAVIPISAPICPHCGAVFE